MPDVSSCFTYHSPDQSVAPFPLSEGTNSLWLASREVCTLASLLTITAVQPGWYVSETAGLTCTQVCGNANLACDAATMLENNDEIDTAAELVSLVSTLTGGNPCTHETIDHYGSASDVPNYKANGQCFFSSPERTLESVDCEGKHSPSFRLCWCSPK